MKRSTNRILTTHAGRLNGPAELTQATQAIQRGQSTDIEAVMPLIRQSMAGVIKQQDETGIDIISDGELGKIGFGLTYYGKRLTGLGTRPVREGEAATMSGMTNERKEFADFYASLNFGGGGANAQTQRVICNGPISYIGQEEVKRDIELFKSSLEASGVKPEETFMCVLAPGWLEHFFYNEYYKDDEAYLFALADAMREEYKAVVDAGFILQLDDPGLPDTYDMIIPHPSIEDYRKFAEVRIAAMNRGLQGIPADRVRYHICWGSWHGPHVYDIELKHVVDLMLEVDAEAYSVEAANPRHEHEWKVWRDTKLPAGKILIPGVVSHASNVVEHPELVADRIIQYAELVGKENVIAGTDCGMGNRVHPQIGWAKFKALSEGAAMASKQLFG
ncbi:MAG TPA: cobalamin-independent methionine synthase II family protein [Dehalococcoidia bacterium]|jgi:5-methyltetrahydropteroyltriglutamate--homocysteine methyltransferase|nr:cobalamin-independent methionine synthase II family protein [Dehalococcoidia bacterium]